MTLKMILIINIIYVKIHKPIFQDPEKYKLHLNSMWLYLGIFMTCLSKHQKEDGNFSVSLDQCPGAKKPQEKA